MARTLSLALQDRRGVSIERVREVVRAVGAAVAQRLGHLVQVLLRVEQRS